MPPRAVGIQPQMALSVVVLGFTCAYAAVNERYFRDQDDLDERLQKRYRADVADQRSKTPQMTATLRGRANRTLDPALDKLVWGGKAKLHESSSSASNHTSATKDRMMEEDDEVNSTNSSSNSRSKRGKRKRKKKRKAGKNVDDETRKLIMQGMAAGASLSAVAVAAIFLLGGTSRRQ